MKKQNSTYLTSRFNMASGEKRIRNIWHSMRSRCRNKNDRYYGGKGITVCDEWNNSFEVFREWAIENGYRDDLTIDRIDSSKNYCPENCKWSTVKEQCNHLSSNRMIEIDGATKTFAQWCDYYNIPQYLAENRLNKYGWSEEEAFKTPANTYNSCWRFIEYNGETHNIMDWSRITGIPYGTLNSRIVKQGWPIERAMTEPVASRKKPKNNGT